MIVVTGATGKLGRHIIEGLLEKVPPAQIVAAVRSPEKAADLAALGVQVRHGDYAQPETLHAAFAGAEKVLLISSNDVEARLEQHQAVINAAKAAGVSLLAYTSVLRADSSALGLAASHRATEEAILASGIPSVFLRNGWYLENQTESLGPAVAQGAIIGAAGDGRFASAARADFAAAAVTVLTGAGHENKIYELAGDTSYTLSDLAAETAKQSGKPVAYHNFSQAEYQKTLEGFGLPVAVADLLADSDFCASKGDLDSDSRDLHTLIGRPTTPLSQAVAHALAA